MGAGGDNSAHQVRRAAAPAPPASPSPPLPPWRPHLDGRLLIATVPTARTAAYWLLPDRVKLPAVEGHVLRPVGRLREGDVAGEGDGVAIPALLMALSAGRSLRR